MFYIYLMSNTHGDDVIPKSLIKLANHLRFKLWRCLSDFHCFVLKSLRSASLCALLYNCFSLSLHISEEALHVLSCYFYLLTCILSTRKPVHSSTHLCSSVTLSFIRSNSFTCQPVYLSTNLSSSVTLSFIRSNSFTCQPCSLVYSHYYIYLPWNRFFSVVPLHRHQEWRDDERSFNEPNNL